MLIVEDTPADADLIMRQIRRLGLSPVFRVVQEEEPYRRALVAFRPHLVLADYRLPRFSGRRALKLARAYDPELPVILVTGTLSERKVLRLVRLGLANYVFKDGMPRLGPAVVQALDRSIARQKEAEARRHAEQMERRLVALARASGDGVLIVDGDQRVVFWNDAASRILGVDGEKALATQAVAFVGMEDRARFEAFWARAVAAAEPPSPFSVELCARRSDGTEIPVEMSVSSWDDGGRRFFSAFLRDITQRRAQARERTLLSRAVEQSSDLVIITDREARIEYVNPAFERITGYRADEVLGLTPRILQGVVRDPALYARMWAELTAGRAFATEFSNRRKDGSHYLQRSSIYPIVGEDGRIERYVGIGEDVTKERDLERQLRQAQKMEAVGQLTGGIAHDFNNLLTAIIGQAQMLMDELPPAHAGPGEPAPEILAAAQRAAELVRRLMVFSRPEGPNVQVVDVRSTVNEVVSMARRVVPESIVLEIGHAPEPLLCSVDPGSLQQAVLNLLNNARDAMPGGGRLTLVTRVAPRQDSRGMDAVLEVSDTGCGIAPEALERVFDPFYTTKPAGKGTGLGLSMVFGFVHHAGGRIGVTSRVGEGTTFTMRLPLADEPSRAEAGPASAGPPAAQARGGETILLAEDQPQIRDLGRQVLERLGYRVITAADGRQAREILADRRGEIDLVVSDVVMPGGGGLEVLRSTAGWDRPPRFLFSSGYASSEQPADAEAIWAHPFIAKPWGIEQFAQAVRAALDARGTPGAG